MGDFKTQLELIFFVIFCQAKNTVQFKGIEKWLVHFVPHFA